ncbi:MAG: undecaprenyldiphospho-muramoylpentapeptide beta-N-acetylglucosaminyltransferase [Eubacteriales bacterium]
MKVILTGGGTGGHIYPAIAIADKIKSVDESAEILFIGTEQGLERELVPQNGYDIKFITVSGFNRKNLLKNVSVIGKAIKGSAEAKKILREFGADVVIGTGGYVCGPVVRTAAKMGILCFIHEQNAFAGITNKLLEKYAKKIFLGFHEAESCFKKKEKLVFTGNPVRAGFFDLDREKCKKKLGIADQKFVILCFGGSRGANKINDVMLQVAENFSGLTDVKLIFVTGKMYYSRIKELADQKLIDENESVEFKKYIDDMPLYLGAADLVISRSGALTVAELMVCNRASILIPSPNVTANHQYYNAKAVQDVGAARIVEEKNLTAENLISVISEIKNNEELRIDMENACRLVSKKDAVEQIYNNLMENFRS